MNKSKLKEILAILSPDGTETDFKAFDEGVDKLKSGLKQKIQAQTLEDVNGQLARFKQGLDLEPLFAAIKDIDKNFDSRIKQVASALAEEVSKFEELSKAERGESAFKIAESAGTVDSLRFELETLKTQKDKEIGDLREAFKNIPAPVDTGPRFAEVYARLDKMALDEANKPDLISPVKKQIEETRADLITRIANSRHGDHANRNIAIGGNTSVLSRYTDINLKAGANVTLTYAYNDQTKYTDVTLAASGGGGGSVGGVIRSINTISTSQTAGAAAGTDYVYLCSAGVQLTLPTAVGNTNLYTIKNTGTSSVLVNTTGGQNIDTQPTVIMPVQFTSIDLISDTGNWNIT